MIENIFTFGFGQKHKNCFVRIKGKDEADCRKKMFEIFGNKWAFQYDDEEKAGVKRWNLTEIKMSGGSLDYVYSKLEYAIDEIQERARTDLEFKFVSHLGKVSKALHDLEWFYSGDYSEEDAMEAIKQVLRYDNEK